jgi:hypothetical protein
MAVIVHVTVEGLTKDQYEALRKFVNWEKEVPKGMRYHVAGFDAKGIRVTDIWDSEADFQHFVRTRLMPGFEKEKINAAPKVETVPLHAEYRH